MSVKKSQESIKDKINSKKNAVSAFVERYADEDHAENNVSLSDLQDSTSKTKSEIQTTVENEELSKNSAVGQNKHDSLDSTLNNIISKDNEKKQLFRGFYLDEDVVNVIDKLSKGKKKGFKSILVNGIVRAVLEDYGYLKK